MTDPDRDFLALLAAERSVSAPHANDRRRNRIALSRKLGVATVLGTTIAKGSVGASLLSAATVKLVATVALVAAGAFSVSWLASQRMSAKVASPLSAPTAPTLALRPSSPPRSVASVSVSPEPSSISSSTAPKPARRVGSDDAQLLLPPPVSETPPVVTSSHRGFPNEANEANDRLAAETKLVSRAQAALRAGNPAQSLALLDEAERQFPSGALGEEALATRVSALCQLGRNAAARAVAARFMTRFPSSLLASRVQSACQLP